MTLRLQGLARHLSWLSCRSSDYLNSLYVNLLARELCILRVWSVQKGELLDLVGDAFKNALVSATKRFPGNLIIGEYAEISEHSKGGADRNLDTYTGRACKGPWLNSIAQSSCTPPSPGVRGFLPLRAPYAPCFPCMTSSSPLYSHPTLLGFA